MPRRVHGSVLRSIGTLFRVGSVGGMTDGQLLDQFLCRQDEGAEAAFAALVGIHGPMVWDVCCGVLSDSHAAEDAFQATFLVLASRARSIRRRDAIGPWLHGVARRVAVRAKTTAARRRLREGEATEMTATPEPDPIPREQIEALHEEVDRLAEKYRAPLVLCYFEGRTHADAARLLRCPVGTVSVRLSRARELLRARMTRRGIVLPAAWAGAVLSSETASAAMPGGLAASTIRAAMNLAAGKAMTAGTVPVAIAQLAEGEIRTMIFTKMTVIAAGVLAIGIGTAGVGLLAAGNRPESPEPGAAAAEQAKAEDQEARARSIKNLKALGLAMHNYLMLNGRFPAAAIRMDGEPLLSWRVALLPFLDQAELYNKFHLDEPWDSPNNKPLLDQMPDIYASVARKKEDPKYSTYYQVFVGPGAMFEGDQGTRIEDITDGTSNTIMIVEAAKPVSWTKPEDLRFDPKKPLLELGGLFEDGFHVALVDGSAFFLSNKIKTQILGDSITRNPTSSAQTSSRQILRALITRNGAEVIPSDQFRPERTDPSRDDVPPPTTPATPTPRVPDRLAPLPR
jgi:RNA polymerase sigma factor (sigma-70 family)